VLAELAATTFQIYARSQVCSHNFNAKDSVQHYKKCEEYFTKFYMLEYVVEDIKENSTLRYEVDL